MDSEIPTCLLKHTHSYQIGRRLVVFLLDGKGDKDFRRWQSNPIFFFYHHLCLSVYARGPDVSISEAHPAAVMNLLQTLQRPVSRPLWYSEPRCVWHHRVSTKVNIHAHNLLRLHVKARLSLNTPEFLSFSSKYFSPTAVASFSATRE